MSTNIKTFADFQSTKTVAPDLGAALSEEMFAGRPGLLYLGALNIETACPQWAGSPAEGHQYCLAIERDGWVGDDLEEMERRLFTFAIDNEYVSIKPLEVIAHALHLDNADDACRLIQNALGITDGGVASMHITDTNWKSPGPYKYRSDLVCGWLGHEISLAVEEVSHAAA